MHSAEKTTSKDQPFRIFAALKDTLFTSAASVMVALSLFFLIGSVIALVIYVGIVNGDNKAYKAELSGELKALEAKLDGRIAVTEARVLNQLERSEERLRQTYDALELNEVYFHQLRTKLEALNE